MAHIITDTQLIQSFIAGNEASIETLIKRHKTRIFSSIFLVVKDQYIAEDIFQETFIKVIRTLKRGKYNDQGKFVPWVVRIARNLAIDHFRRKAKMPLITGQDGYDVFNHLKFDQVSPEQLMIKNEKHSKVRELIRRLPKEQQEVLILRHYSELSFKEIAVLTKVSINTALGRMRYAMQNMKIMVEENAILIK